MIELKRHIEILLLSNDCVIVPDFGGFMAHHVEARYDGNDYTFLPPLRTIGFNPQLKLNDSLLVQSYVEAYDISYPEAQDRIAAEVVEIRQHLENTGKYELSDIGTLFLNEDGNLTFEPCEAGILTPDYYGLGGFEMKSLEQLSEEEEAPDSKARRDSRQEAAAAEVRTLNVNTVFDASADSSVEEEEESTEFITIRKSLLQNIAAACIAVVAFFALSTPLGTPSVQKSQIDTGMLQRILVQDAVKASANVLQEPAGAVSPETGRAAKAAAGQAEGRQPYYSIVLASRVSKQGAELFVEQLHKQGLTEASVLVTAHNVKVIFGAYASREEARGELNRRQAATGLFADSWITRVDE